MRKMMLLVLALFLVASVGLVACAEEATPTPVPTPAPLQAPSITLDGVFVPSPGGNVTDPATQALLVGMVVEAAFTISNPNDYMITVDSVDYTLQVNSESVGSIVAGEPLVIKGLYDDMYVPANGQITVGGSSYVGFYGMFVLRILQKGQGAGDAIGDGIKVWEAVKKGELTWTVTGNMQVISPYGNTAVPISATFKP
ncbi:MAG: LEA type 2 family protein [Dehalococcoidia bacterium]